MHSSSDQSSHMHLVCLGVTLPSWLPFCSSSLLSNTSHTSLEFLPRSASSLSSRCSRRRLSLVFLRHRGNSSSERCPRRCLLKSPRPRRGWSLSDDKPRRGRLVSDDFLKSPRRMPLGRCPAAKCGPPKGLCGEPVIISYKPCTWPHSRHWQ